MSSGKGTLQRKRDKGSVLGMLNIRIVADRKLGKHSVSQEVAHFSRTAELEKSLLHQLVANKGLIGRKSDLPFLRV